MSKSHKDIIFDDEIGQKALVEHHVIENTPEMLQLKDVLSDMGKDLQRIKVASPELEYMGSFSVHIYASTAIKGNYMFVPVTAPGKCFYKLAEAGMIKLKEDVREMYVGKRHKLRSGF